MTQTRSSFVQPLPLPPAGVPTARCGRCGGTYIASPVGHEAHVVVFGHAPAATQEPQGAAS